MVILSFLFTLFCFPNFATFKTILLKIHRNSINSMQCRSLYVLDYIELQCGGFDGRFGREKRETPSLVVWCKCPHFSITDGKNHF